MKLNHLLFTLMFPWTTSASVMPTLPTLQAPILSTKSFNKAISTFIATIFRSEITQNKETGKLQITTPNNQSISEQSIIAKTINLDRALSRILNAPQVNRHELEKTVTLLKNLQQTSYWEYLKEVAPTKVYSTLKKKIIALQSKPHEQKVETILSDLEKLDIDNTVYLPWNLLNDIMNKVDRFEEAVQKLKTLDSYNLEALSALINRAQQLKKSSLMTLLKECNGVKKWALKDTIADLEKIRQTYIDKKQQKTTLINSLKLFSTNLKAGKPRKQTKPSKETTPAQH